MVSIPKNVTVMSCGMVVCLTLSNAVPICLDTLAKENVLRQRWTS
jgi:hypothetical protein